jgi:SAM-dependent methyltransferase
MDPSLERSLLEAEDSHYWFRARRRILGDVIRSLPLPASPRILDVGCGGGRFLIDLAQVGVVSAIEPLPASFEVAQARGVADVRRNGIDDIPFEPHAFDLITCLDVVEHIEDDVGAFRAMREMARPGAHLAVTVPAYQWLWSDHDRINHHFRRYNRRSLDASGVAGGWQPVRWTYFNASLLPPAVLVRSIERARHRRVASERVLVHTPPLANRLLHQPLRVEAALLRAGVRLPAGLSLLAVFRNEPEGG